jgi:putative glutamine amidotransferase
VEGEITFRKATFMRPVILVTCSGLRTQGLSDPMPPVQTAWPGPATYCQADKLAAKRGCLRLHYLQAIELSGGAGLLLPNSPDPDNARSAASVADGLLLSGGWDINPRLYGQSRHSSVIHVDDVRDATELAAIRAAIERRIPILAICRGIQALNVALGGSLIQDIPALPLPLPSERRCGHSGTDHAIDIVAGSVLAGLWGVRITVNSRHHQALDRLGESLKVTARAPDGIVEAVESADGYPLLAVQCHPEDMWQANRQYLKPFAWLVDESLRRPGRRD